MRTLGHRDVVLFYRKLVGSGFGSKGILIPVFNENGLETGRSLIFSMHFRHGCSDKKLGGNSDTYSYKEIQLYLQKERFALTGIPKLVEKSIIVFQ